MNDDRFVAEPLVLRGDWDSTSPALGQPTSSVRDGDQWVHTWDLDPPRNYQPDTYWTPIKDEPADVIDVDFEVQP